MVLSAAIVSNVHPMALPAIAVQRPVEASPPPPTVDPQIVIPPGIPEAPKIAKEAHAIDAVESPGTPVDFVKKRKRPTNALVSSFLNESPKSAGKIVALSKRPPLSPDRYRRRYGGSGSVGGSSSSSPPPSPRSTVREGDLLSLLSEGSPWTDTQFANVAPPSPPSSRALAVPDLSPWPLKVEIELAAAPTTGAMSLSPSKRDDDRGTMSRTAELLFELEPSIIEEDSVEDSWKKDMEEEDDLVGLKFVSFDEQ
mmetsp:Transcript_35270/g.64838  ORF Transcript_35270/g.64838 Transcript_35270/m.64838 type:complete len:254 (-) Transcript_35270:170-931(-)|eukprot:CAMPEP_0197448388 /NCGR_PEP_ID=MMETSP1175-20131217/17200_1 /TAXON_ID=1003142 /ORGANISM="Triceratium dubium, Strain CCMP147" /LENGTH=253 /DNA_ID=CAMNT_0042980115 /DNA_START=483 /DNA_END=1244 /DNA_ORIENTATION=-